jgi:hypothetical protein
MSRFWSITSAVCIVGMSTCVAFGGENLAFDWQPAAAELDSSIPRLSLTPGSLYGEAVLHSPSTSTASTLAPFSLGAPGGSDTNFYVTGKLGPLFFIDDFKDLDVGLNAEVALGFQPISILALEVASGFYWGEEDRSSSDAELWGIPIVANAKVSIPVLILELYGGLGIGGYYIDTELKTPNVRDDDDDFVWGGNAFLGLNLNLGRLILGLEGKYILTEKADVAGGGRGSLEGLAAMVSFGLRF